MYPTFNVVGDVVLTSKIHDFSKLKVNDIVEARSSGHGGIGVLKRILCLGGDYIENPQLHYPLFTTRKVYVPPKLQAVSSYRPTHPSPMYIPQGMVWIQGDHESSVDSRFWGPVPLSLIQSKAVA
eukprot:CAMPEP_0201556178 /NCGR_PEP_ID=MMETSP0173_2-20130828/53717_1 /ASSEMBLY_ACC=CAM_ASM_000268 /TAXON_ID=218659 /ORGANISM="Vexillifera sp., Strain DIVA3 564/2" /LENGTH=124 /DNA_ID=CAMNT_0047968319 /DNA_START=1 /DNA_END=371 /DNA_ORIENTATION=-